MSDYRPLDCDLHDYLEIACLYRYLLRIELADCAPFMAEAVTTETMANKEEFLVVQVEGTQHRLRLDRLQAITPLSAKARFGRVEMRGAT